MRAKVIHNRSFSHKPNNVCTQINIFAFGIRNKLECFQIFSVFLLLLLFQMAYNARPRKRNSIEVRLGTFGIL